MQSSTQPRSAPPPLAAQPNSTSNADTSSTRAIQVRVSSSPSKPTVQPRRLAAARSPLFASASAPAPSSSSSSASSKLLAAIQRGGPANTAAANNAQPIKLRTTAPTPAARVLMLAAPPPSGALRQIAPTAGAMQNQQTQSADQLNMQRSFNPLLQSIMQQKLQAARSKQTSLYAPAAAAAATAAASSRSAAAAVISLATVAQINNQQQIKALLATMRAQRDAAAAGSTDEQQTQTADQQSKQCLIPVAAGSPPHWDPIDPAHGNTSLVMLSKDNPKHAAELAWIDQNWSGTGGLGALVSVHRIQNPVLHRRYESWKQRHPWRHQERIVYHGTRGTPPALIYQSETGFDPSFGQAQPGHLWFAEEAFYSSEGYAHHVSRSQPPFTSSGSRSQRSGDPHPSWSDYGQILQAKIWVDPVNSAMLNGGQNGVHLISKSQQALPTHLLTFQRYRYPY